jgi:hypothetical protein
MTYGAHAGMCYNMCKLILNMLQLIKSAYQNAEEQGIAIIELCPNDAAASCPCCFVWYDVVNVPQCPHVAVACFGICANDYQTRGAY